MAKPIIIGLSAHQPPLSLLPSLSGTDGSRLLFCNSFPPSSSLPMLRIILQTGRESNKGRADSSSSAKLCSSDSDAAEKKCTTQRLELAGCCCESDWPNGDLARAKQNSQVMLEMGGRRMLWGMAQNRTVLKLQRKLAKNVW